MPSSMTYSAHPRCGHVRSSETLTACHELGDSRIPGQDIVPYGCSDIDLMDLFVRQCQLIEIGRPLCRKSQAVVGAAAGTERVCMEADGARLCLES